MSKIGLLGKIKHVAIEMDEFDELFATDKDGDNEAERPELTNDDNGTIMANRIFPGTGLQSGLMVRICDEARTLSGDEYYFVRCGKQRGWIPSDDIDFV